MFLFCCSILNINIVILDEPAVTHHHNTTFVKNIKQLEEEREKQDERKASLDREIKAYKREEIAENELLKIKNIL